MDRFVPDHICPDASQIILENAYVVTRDTKGTKDYITSYTMACILQFGAVEFKTLNDLEKDYGEER